MKISCKLFGHKNKFHPDEDDSKCGRYICERCDSVTGAVGKVNIVEYVCDHTNKVEKITDELMKIMEIYYPGISTMKYDAGDDITNFRDRMSFGLSVELMKAGLIK